MTSSPTDLSVAMIGHDSAVQMQCWEIICIGCVRDIARNMNLSTNVGLIGPEQRQISDQKLVERFEHECHSEERYYLLV